MVRVFITFNLGVLNMAVGGKVWLLALIAANMIVPVFFISTREARSPSLRCWQAWCS